MRVRGFAFGALGVAVFILLAGTLLAACGDDAAGDDGNKPAADASADSGDGDGDDDAADGGPMGDGDDDGGGLPPTVPVLLMPEDAAVDVPIESMLCWEPSTDPEGDPIRYRVYLDGLELSTGVVGGDAPQGFEGPCTPELLFKHDTVYEWFVVAFDPDHPHVMSGSATWTFATEWDGDGRVVFEDDFSTEQGWEVSGEAETGQWTSGTPGEVVHSEAEGSPLSQPGACFRGDTCWFTAQNPGADASDGDVDGGSTVLLSPPFDLTDALSVTVSLTRFFYRGDERQRGTRLQVELLIPDDSAAGGYQVFVLEELDYENAEGLNTWMPVAFAVCDVPFGPGARLRITATDPDVNVVEAAIDNVQVTAHRTTDTCTMGEGALCNPSVPDVCGTDLLCCGRGSLNYGVFRCTEPAPAIDRDDFPAPGTDIYNGELGCPLPDLVPTAMPETVRFDDVDVSPDSCAVMEGCVGGTGMRRLMRFSMASQNFGAADLKLGVPANHPDLFHFDDCHDHYHFDGFAVYRLLDADGNEVAQGQKLAQCLWDHSAVVFPGEDNGIYSCFTQGISAGWQDVYDTALQCQWIDVTGVPEGDYTVRVEINMPTAESAPKLVERDYANNTFEFGVTVPAP